MPRSVREFFAQFTPHASLPRTLLLSSFIERRRHSCAVGKYERLVEKYPSLSVANRLRLVASHGNDANAIALVRAISHSHRTHFVAIPIHWFLSEDHPIGHLLLCFVDRVRRTAEIWDSATSATPTREPTLAAVSVVAPALPHPLWRY
jgi:hypothetical protein